VPPPANAPIAAPFLPPAIPPMAAPPSAVPATVSLSRCFFQKLRFRRTRRRVCAAAAAATDGCAEATELMGSIAKPTINSIKTTATYRFIFCITIDAFIRCPLFKPKVCFLFGQELCLSRGTSNCVNAALKPIWTRSPRSFGVSIRGVNVRKCSSLFDLKLYPSQTSTPHRSCNSAGPLVWDHLRTRAQCENRISHITPRCEFPTNWCRRPRAHSP